MKIWFTSDNHFSHKNIVRFCPNTRPHVTPEELDELMVEKWNGMVEHGDTVYCLGDVFFCNFERAESILKRLNGNIHLVYGNHDKVIKNNPRLQNLFKSISDYKELKIDGVDVVLFHFPMLEWNKMHYGAYHLFGHVHGNMDNDPNIVSARCMDVGIDSRPRGIEPENGMLSLWSWAQVHKILKGRPIRGHHSK
jgi:calcineurin-like phosphoesterase family protein